MLLGPLPEKALPEKALDEGVGPFRRTQQVAQSLGACGSLICGKDLSSQLTEQQAVPGVAQHQDGLERPEKGSDQSFV